ncbi:aminotransferase class I/II-fold pyridoxal phosphate-dependent enzyme, partial [Staphylococcus gallinarum]
HDIKIFYLMTRFQNPTGHSYSEHEKKYIVSLLNKYDVYLIEDDYLGDLDFNNKSHTFYYYDNSNRVIYVKSFSKIYMPGLRIGCAVMPKSLGEKFKNLKFTHDFNSPILSQGALEIYMKNGMFSKHLKKLKLLYQKKIKILLFYCNKYLGRNIRYSVPNNGFFITIYLPVSVDSTQITNTLNANNVHVKDCKDMYLNFNNQYNSIRLCASSIKIDKIEKGIKLIAQTVENMKIN